MRAALIALLVLVVAPPASAALRARTGADAESSVRDGGRLAAASHTCHVKADGTVACWGDNFYGQIGDGTRDNDRHQPVSVVRLTDAQAVTVGSNHSCALRIVGRVVCWGLNENGEIGDGGDGRFRLEPSEVSGLIAVVAVAAGDHHTCAVRFNGTVVCWGLNNEGQLGDGTRQRSAVPVQALGVVDAVAVVAGLRHTCVLRATGGVQCWGLNERGQLGDGTTQPRTSPVAVTGLGDAASVSASRGDSTCAVRANGTVRCWGANYFQQLGDGTFEDRPTPITVPGVTGIAAVSVGTSHACVLRATGTVRCWGSLTRGEHVEIQDVEGATAIAVGGVHGCALRVAGDVRCWGVETSGQLGDGVGSSIPRPSIFVPVTVLGISGSISARGIWAHVHSCARRADGAASCWGPNFAGQVGDGSTVDRASPVPVGGLGEVAAMALGTGHTCALQASGSVRCWGLNDYGQVGNATTVDQLAPADVRFVAGAVAIGAGDRHTCALVVDGTVRCWGGNFSGQLGTGNTVDRSVSVAVLGVTDAVGLAVGGYHACALRASGSVVCWGQNDAGQLGDGTTTTQLRPVPVLRVADAVALAAGAGHTCAVRANGEAQCWGLNTDGQLGRGTSAQEPTPVTVLGIPGFPSLVAGSFHTCGRRETGRVVCWGDNGSGQVGDGSRVDRDVPRILSTPQEILALAGGDLHTCAVDVRGQPFCWGRNDAGELGDGTTEDRLAAVAVPSFTFNVAPRADLGGRGRRVTVTALVTCDPGERVSVHVDLTQGAVRGHGHAVERCPGGLAAFPVTVHVKGRVGFTEGAATAEASAVVRARRDVVDVQDWTRAIQLER
jgi:alpha-tubulin suppressor-like RCC1 family protein